MNRKDLGVDPEYHRYRRSYPRFPGVKVCVDLLRRRNVHGAYLDGVMGDLAADHRLWGAVGLHKLDTPEARRALWDARSQTFSDPAETARHLQMLDEVKHWSRHNHFLPGGPR